MSIDAVVGANWGDEGKGRMVDYLARDASFVVRYQGGNNAGHTVVNDLGEFKLHLLPSGVFYPGVVNVLGPGMVIDLEGLCEELDELAESNIHPTIKISDRATICFPFHRIEDGLEEDRLGKDAYGSTLRGIAPAYGDRTVKKALQMGELLHPERFEKRLRSISAWKLERLQAFYGKKDIFAIDDMLAWAEKFGGRLREYIADTSIILEEGAKAGKNILFEAQLGTLRDLNFGIYPFTTSSCTLASYAPIGSGLMGYPLNTVLAVVKAFSTCVGEGPFVAIMDKEEGDALRVSAKEFGASTGRPRTIGHFDAVATRYGVKMQGATDVALTKLDCLSGRPSLKICTHYAWQGKNYDTFPLNAILEEATPVYKEMPGWEEDVTQIRRYEDLPAAARDYVEEIERLIECRLRYVSVGPEREALIIRD
ncbi:MAG: adenylosuccinate synthase [Candidatus Hydrogenedens sp.]|jgi:adenylosuccinate synthase|nr:adenylosuccinate synthase [Candidatus Hydrogenedens sp.]